MRRKIIFMYSGQGSQFYNMGLNLYQGNKIFQDSMLYMDKKFQEKLGYSIIEHLYDKKKSFSNPFHDIAYTHSAIFMVEYAVTQVLKSMGIEPDYVFGCSLGEFSALTAAGVLPLEEAVDFIAFQTKLLKEQDNTVGSMTAVMEDIRLLSFLKEAGQVETAAINYSRHFVISGKTEALLFIQNFLKEHKIMYQKLPVDFAFHSSMIEKIKETYEEYAKRIPLSKPQIPIISGIDGSMLDEIQPSYLWDIIRRPMAFISAKDTITKIGGIFCIDTGTAGTMAGFMKNNLSKEEGENVAAIITPFGKDIENLNHLGKR